MKFPPVQETYSLTTVTTIPTGNLKETTVASNMSSVSSTTYSYPNFKSIQQPVQSHSYSSIPLPPSLAVSKSSPKQQNASINMSGADLLPKVAFAGASEQSKMYQTSYYLSSPTSASKYNRELNINPTLSSNPNYTRSYRS